MKILNLLLFLLCLQTFSIAQDNISPNQKARREINKIKDNKVKQLNLNDLDQALNAIADMASSRTPFLTQQELRSGKADEATIVYINEGLRSGSFRYDPNSTAKDDSSLVIVSGKRRYVRDNVEYLRPEWFGANPNDDKDDFEAIQKLLNIATTKGLNVHFSTGYYLTSKPLRLKNVTNAGQYNYYITISGSGEGRTTIEALPGIKGDLLFMDSGLTGLRVSFVTISNLTLSANGANRCFWASMPGYLKFENVFFNGGEDVCCKIGTYGSNECFSIYFTKCYFNGGTLNGGQNNTLLQLHQTRMVVVDQMESDGGKYSIDLYGSDKATIVNSKLEGAKRAGIIIRGGYGGEHKIANNLINPYIGGDINGQYDGSLSGIEIAGGGYNNISSNQILVPGGKSGKDVYSISNLTGEIIPHSSHLVKGSKSGATGKILEYNKVNKRINLNVTKGEFLVGETLKQANTGATFQLGEGTLGHSYGVLVSSGAYSIINGNTIRLNPEYGVAGYSDGIICNSNFIEATKWGVYATGSMTLTGNQISAPENIAIERAYNNQVLASNNLILAGSVKNILSPTNNGNGALILSNGGILSDNGNKLQVSGNSNFDGSVTVSSLPVHFDNASATKAGLQNGALYRTPGGDLKVKF